MVKAGRNAPTREGLLEVNWDGCGGREVDCAGGIELEGVAAFGMNLEFIRVEEVDFGRIGGVVGAPGTALGINGESPLKEKAVEDAVSGKQSQGFSPLLPGSGGRLGLVSAVPCVSTHPRRGIAFLYTREKAEPGCVGDVADGDGLEEEPAVIYLSGFFGSKLVALEDVIHDIRVIDTLGGRNVRVIQAEFTLDRG